MIKSDFFHRNHKIVLVFLLFLIFIKFFFLNNSILLSKNYADQIFNKKISKLDSKLEKNRDWGPIFFESYKYINDNKNKNLIFKIIEFICLIILIYVVFKLFRIKVNEKYNQNIYDVLILLIILMSSSLYYSFIYGSGDLITALLSILQFYFFLKKKYFYSVIVLIFGIYYKFILIIPFGTILLISLIIKKERKLFFYFLIFLFLLFLTYILFYLPQIKYPINIIINLITDIDNFTPPISFELFDLRTLILKLIIYSNFISFDSSQLNVNLINKTLIILFSFLYLFSILLIIFRTLKIQKPNKIKLSREESLIKFYILSGFIFLLLFFEVSIEKSLMYFMCILSPLLVNIYSNFRQSYRTIILFLFGLLFFGNVIPISIMYDLNLFNYYKTFLDYPNELIGWKAFIFSHAPYIGIVLIFISFIRLNKDKI